MTFKCTCCYSCRLGGVIVAYKIVPDEIDEIKVMETLQNATVGLYHLCINVFFMCVCVFYMATGYSFGMVR